jgi:PPOX class probable F420-dependent enzyme
MDQLEMRSRFMSSPVAHLATVGADGRPHIVPICFALADELLYFVIDSKPKRTTNLKRLRNIAANPAASILVDHYEDDWGSLWWVRIDGEARVATDQAEIHAALRLLRERYSQYRASTPAGPVVAVAITGISGWSAS